MKLTAMIMPTPGTLRGVDGCAAPSRCIRQTRCASAAALPGSAGGHRLTPPRPRDLLRHRAAGVRHGRGDRAVHAVRADRSRRAGRTTPDPGSAWTDVTASDVDAVRARQRELGIPEAFEWVHETTPIAARGRPGGWPARRTSARCSSSPVIHRAAGDLARPSRFGRWMPDAADLGTVHGAIGAGFAGADDFMPSDPGPVAATHAGRSARGVRRVRRHGRRRWWLALAAWRDHRARSGSRSLPRARRRGIGAAITQPSSLTRERAASRRCSCPRGTTRWLACTSGSASSGSARRASPSRPTVAEPAAVAPESSRDPAVDGDDWEELAARSGSVRCRTLRMRSGRRTSARSPSRRPTSGPGSAAADRRTSPWPATSPSGSAPGSRTSRDGCWSSPCGSIRRWRGQGSAGACWTRSSAGPASTTCACTSMSRPRTGRRGALRALRVRRHGETTPLRPGSGLHDRTAWRCRPDRSP